MSNPVEHEGVQNGRFVATADHDPEEEYEVSWEPFVADRIGNEALEVSITSQRPYMVALVGIPGSGKSVSASLLAASLDELGCHSMVMPHDGYHYPMDRLRVFPDAPDAIYRRGAPDTFDAAALLRDLRRIRDGEEQLVPVPAFDHAKVCCKFV
jgi:pantothenate kinase